MYEFRLVNITGEEIWVLPFETVTVTEELNLGITGNITINYQALKRYANILATTPDDIVSAEYREWQLWKDDELFYAGVLLHYKLFGSKGQGTNMTIEFAGFEKAFDSRITGNAGADWAWSSVDSADIAWDMINKTQNDASGYGDIGVTRGLHPTTVDRDNTCRFDSIYKEIVSMSAREKYNGYDFRFSPLKVFDIFYPAMGELKSNLVLDDFNILSWSKDKDLATRAFNRVTVLGQGSEDDIVTATVEDELAMAKWFLQEVTLAEKDVIQTSTLEDKGNKLLNQKKEPANVVAVRVNDRDPDIKSYNVGDTLPVQIKEIDFNENLRIDRRTIQIQRSGEAQVDLSFEYDN